VGGRVGWVRGSDEGGGVEGKEGRAFCARRSQKRGNDIIVPLFSRGTGGGVWGGENVCGGSQKTRILGTWDLITLRRSR